MSESKKKKNDVATVKKTGKYASPDNGEKKSESDCTYNGKPEYGNDTNRVVYVSKSLD